MKAMFVQAARQVQNLAQGLFSDDTFDERLPTLRKKEEKPQEPDVVIDLQVPPPPTSGDTSQVEAALNAVSRVDPASVRPDGVMTLPNNLLLRTKATKENLRAIYLPRHLGEYHDPQMVTPAQFVHAVDLACQQAHVAILRSEELDGIFVAGPENPAVAKEMARPDPVLRSAGTYRMEKEILVLVPVIYNVRPEDLTDSGTQCSLKLGTLLRSRPGTAPLEGVEGRRGFILDFQLNAFASNFPKVPLEIKLSTQGSTWSTWKHSLPPAVIYLPPPAPQMITVMGDLSQIEMCSQGYWKSMIPETHGSLGTLTASASSSLFAKAVYPSDHHTITRCASWAFFVADRPRSYFESLGTLVGSFVHVQRTPETVVLLSCLVDALRQRMPLCPAAWQKLLHELRLSVVDHTGDHYRMRPSTWTTVLEFIQPFLQPDLLENMEILVKRFDGEPFPPEPVFSLEFRLSYVDLTEYNNPRLWGTGGKQEL